MAEELIGALTGEVRVLVADMTATVLCDASGARALMAVYRRAAGQGAGLRLVVPSARIRQVLGLLGVDRTVPVYPGLSLAIADALGLPGPFWPQDGSHQPGRVPGVAQQPPPVVTAAGDAILGARD